LPILTLAAFLLGTACTSAAPASPQSSGGSAAAPAAQPARTKTIVFGVNVIQPLGIGSVSSSSGGWVSASELHTNGLISSDETTRTPVGRLAARVPTVDNGDITVLPDGRMRVVYSVRPNVTWHDGVPFTAQDLVFTQRFWADPGVPPYATRTVLNLIESSEAPDDATFVLYFKQPIYLAATMGQRVFWPVARHIIQAPYEEAARNGNTAEIENHPYWTSQYVGTGPFRVTSFDVGTGVSLERYDGFFLGRPKVDTVRIQVFANQQALYSSILAGAVDVFPENTLTGDLVFDLQERWDSAGAGKSWIKRASTRFVAPQWRPAVQMEPANLDVRVRAALYHAIDRETLAEALHAGHKELAAWEILPPNDPNYAAVKDGMRQFGFDPERAKAMLRELGWTPGPDGILRHASDGRRFKNAIMGSPGQAASELLPVADYWQRLGLEMEIMTTSPANSRDLQHLASFPGWSMAAHGVGEGILARMEGPAAGPQSRWQGNAGGYDDPTAKSLIERYRASLSPGDQLEAMQAINAFVVAELPFMVLFDATHSIGRRTGVIALDDHEGGDNGSRSYGNYTRNAHLWDLQ
jgi:peptide/nickel transport system substrate-binding protein